MLIIKKRESKDVFACGGNGGIVPFIRNAWIVDHWAGGWIGINNWYKRYWQRIYLSLRFTLTSACISEAENPEALYVSTVTHIVQTKQIALTSVYGMSENINYSYFFLNSTLPYSDTWNAMTTHKTLHFSCIRWEVNERWCGANDR
jgi:hypothetical protein